MTKRQYVHPHTGALVGASIPRIEDKAFLKGSAQFIEDLLLPRMSHVEFVRSVGVCSIFFCGIDALFGFFVCAKFSKEK